MGIFFFFNFNESGDDNGKWVAFLIAPGYLATSCAEMVRLKVCMRVSRESQVQAKLQWCFVACESLLTLFSLSVQITIEEIFLSQLVFFVTLIFCFT